MASKWILALTFFCAGVHAAPTSPSAPVAPAFIENDEIAAFLHARGLVPQLQEMGQSVASHTSELISTAMGMIGVAYRRGGTDAASGFDCSGFVRNVYAQVAGHLLPRVARDQAKATQKIAKNELQPGDLVFFNTMRRAFSHVGIYLGNGKFIHAPRSGSAVRIENIKDSYWAKRFNGARRVPVSDTTVAQSQDMSSLTVSPSAGSPAMP